jgi:hypothetical protein
VADNIMSDTNGVGNDDNSTTTPPPPTKARLCIPESLLSVESTEEATITCFNAGLKPILIHAPTADGGCSCGKAHDKTASGSSSTGKHPIQSNWSKRNPSLDELKDQIARCRFMPNVGMVLGKQRDGEYIIAVDVDDASRFAELEAELGPLPETPRCDSGRGYRLFFTLPPEIDVDRLKNITGLGGIPGVDVKAEGGQVVIAPSLHANGKRYVWTRIGEIVPLPLQWAMQLLKKFEKPKFIDKYTPAQMNKPGQARTRAEKYLDAAVDGEARALAGCGSGMRNNTLFASACRLFKLCAGMYLASKWHWVHDELLRAARAAGLPEHEVRATLASADRTVRESGDVISPMVLADPAPSSPPGPGPYTEPPPPDDPWGLSPSSQTSKKPTINITHEVMLNADEAISALKRDPEIYQRETKLVFVARIKREQSEESDTVPTDDGQTHRQLVEGSPQICEMETPTLRERLSSVAHFQKWSSRLQNYVPFIPTDEIVGAVKKRANWPGIRPLIGVVETPILRSDGQIIQTEGYDPSTRYVYSPGQQFPSVTDEMATRDNAKWAFRFLSECFEDFPYVNESHRSVPIAAILTLIARPAILGSVPAVLFDASTRGSGKTLQTDAIATVATGRGAPRMNYTIDEVELEKILASYALRGSSFICLDNIPAMRPFGGGPIDRIITVRDDVELRVLGYTKVVTLQWRALIMATGNNISFYGDTSRRVLMARLEPIEEKPERRTKFRHDDLLSWIRKERPRLVAAALLILRAYFLAGKPPMGCARWGSFEEWSRLIPHAIVFAGGADPMLARPEVEEDVDNELRSIRTIMNSLHSMLGSEDFRISSVIDLLYRCQRTPDPINGGYKPDGLEDTRDAIETLVGKRGMKHEGRGGSVPDAVELGRRLAAFKGRVIDGHRLVAKPGAAGVMRWRVVPMTAPSIGTVYSEASEPWSPDPSS